MIKNLFGWIWFQMQQWILLGKNGMKTTGHGKCRVMVELAAKGDGTKLKSFIVLKGGNCDVEKSKKE